MGSRDTPSLGAAYRHRDGRALLGPLLTEHQFARRIGLSPAAVRRHRSVPRIGSSIGLGAAYPAFMLDEHGLRLDVAFVTLLLRRRVDDLTACDWLIRPNPELGGRTPLDWIGNGLPLEDVIEALPSTHAETASARVAREVDAIREEWLRFKGDEETPGWSVAWDRIARTWSATPHGV